MANAASTSFVIKYAPGGGENSIIKVEVDEEEHENTSTFEPGTTVHFRVYANCNYSFTLSDSGSEVKDNGTGTAEIADETITFSGSKTASIQYPFDSGWSFEWLGDTTLVTPSAPSSGNTKITLGSSAGENPVGVGNATYTTSYDKKKFVPSESLGSETQVVVFVQEDL